MIQFLAYVILSQKKDIFFAIYRIINWMSIFSHKNLWAFKTLNAYQKVSCVWMLCRLFECILIKKWVLVGEYLIYDPGDVFRTKYNTIALKPLGVVVYDQNGKPEVSTHSTVLTLCRGKQPIVCLPPSMVHFSPNARLQGVILKPTRTSKEGREYAPCVGLDNLSDDFVQTILNGIVTE